MPPCIGAISALLIRPDWVVTEKGDYKGNRRSFDSVCCADMRVPAVTPDKVRPDVEWKLVQRRLVNAKRSPPAQNRRIWERGIE